MTSQERLGQNIRARRTYLGWSQEQLARRLSVGSAAVSTYEKGTRAITPEVLQQIADALQTTVRELWGEVLPNERKHAPQYKIVASSEGVIDLTPEEQRLLDLFVRGVLAGRASDEEGQDNVDAA